MPEFRCYMCGATLTIKDLNEERTGFTCPKCSTDEEKTTTLLEPQYYGVLGIRPPDKD